MVAVVEVAESETSFPHNATFVICPSLGYHETLSSKGGLEKGQR